MKKKNNKPVKTAVKSKKAAKLQPKKIAASILAANAFSMSMPVNVLASDITGITPNGNVYNINAERHSGSTGFRQYENFQLTKDDIANLQFKNGQQHFVNLVDNQININGILNTMQGNNFYNGHAIFVSPAGMIVGSSGVLNVGSLTMMAPSQNAYDYFLYNFNRGIARGDLYDFEYDPENGNYRSLIQNSSGTIDINGKIFARDSVNAYARTISIGTDENAKPAIFAGLQGADDLVINSNAQAESLFNELVNNDVEGALGVTLEDGEIKLVTNKPSEEILTSVVTIKKAENEDEDDTKLITTYNVETGLKTYEIGSDVEEEEEEEEEESIGKTIANLVKDTVEEFLQDKLEDYLKEQIKKIGTPENSNNNSSNSNNETSNSNNNSGSDNSNSSSESSNNNNSNSSNNSSSNNSSSGSGSSNSNNDTSNSNEGSSGSDTSSSSEGNTSEGNTSEGNTSENGDNKDDNNKSIWNEDNLNTISAIIMDALEGKLSIVDESMYEKEVEVNIFAENPVEYDAAKEHYKNYVALNAINLIQSIVNEIPLISIKDGIQDIDISTDAIKQELTDILTEKIQGITGNISIAEMSSAFTGSASSNMLNDVPLIGTNSQAQVLAGEIVDGIMSNIPLFGAKDESTTLLSGEGLQSDILDNTIGQIPYAGETLTEFINDMLGGSTAKLMNAIRRTEDFDIKPELSKDSTLSEDDSAINISNAFIKSGKIELEANAVSEKVITEDSIKEYGTAKKLTELILGKEDDVPETATDWFKNKLEGDDDDNGIKTGYEIHENSNGMADEANAIITIKDAKLEGDEISISANASNTTENYIQLLDTLVENWVKLGIKDLSSLTGLDKVADIIPDSVLEIVDDDLKELLQSDEDGSLLKAAITSYFSDKPYIFFDGAKSSAVIEIENSEITASDSLSINANASSSLNIKTGKLDSLPMFIYGLGASADSQVNIKGAALVTENDDAQGSIEINAVSTIENEINYDSSGFLAVSEKKKEENSNGENSEGNNSNGENNSNENNDTDKPEENKSDEDKKKEEITKTLDEKTEASKEERKEKAEAADKKDDDNNSNGENSSENSGNNNENDDKDKDKEYENTVSAYQIAILNNAIISNASVNIEESTIETNDLNVRAIDFNKSEIEMKNVSRVGKESDKTGIAAGIIINHTDTNSSIEVLKSEISINGEAGFVPDIDEDTGEIVKDEETGEIVGTDFGGARFIAQNINAISNSVETKVEAKKQTSDIKSKELNEYDTSLGISIYKWLNEKILDKVEEKMSSTLDKANMQISGSVIINNSNNNSSSVIKESTIEASYVEVQSNMVDFTVNKAEAEAGANSKFGSGASVIVNNQDNTNIASIIDSEINSEGDVKVNATTQLPMNPLELKFGQEVEEDDDDDDGDDKKDDDNKDNNTNNDSANSSSNNDSGNSNSDNNSGDNQNNGDNKDGDKKDGEDDDDDDDDHGKIDLEDDPELYIGVGFDAEDEITKWTPEFIHTDFEDLINKDTIEKTYKAIKKNKTQFLANMEFGLDGLFNNLAKAESAGKNLGVAGSIVVNSIDNNTTASVTGSQINITPPAEIAEVPVVPAVENVEAGEEDTPASLTVNAANSVVQYNGAGKVDFLLELMTEYTIGKLKNDDDDDPDASKFGVGGSVLVNNINNDAIAKIDNSVITVKEGDVNVGSATEEVLGNILVTGGSAETLAVEGSVNVQNVGGKTQAAIENESNVTALNVNVTAGKALIATKESGDDPMELDEDTNELNMHDERKVEDFLINVNFLGVNAIQDVEVENENEKSSSGVSVGASINAAGIKKEIEAVISDSEINADENVNVKAETDSKRIDVLAAGSFAGGVSVKENKDKEKEEEKKEEAQKTNNAGNWMDILDSASDDDEDVLGLNALFNENESSKEAAKETKDNEGLKEANNGVDKDGNETDKSSEDGNAKNLSESNDLKGEENKSANATTASDNLSLALAGTVNVTSDNTSVIAKIINSEINSGKDVNVTSDYDTLVVDINGGLAKSGTVGLGAGVNIYRNLSQTKSLIQESTIDVAKTLNVLSDADIYLVDVTAGAADATKADENDQGTKVAVGGSFAWNTLKNTVSSQILESTIDSEENANVNVKAEDDSTIWNATGGVGVTTGNSKSTGVGAGIAATVNLSKKNIIAEVMDSYLNDVKDVQINADLSQNYNTMALAAAVVKMDNSNPVENEAPGGSSSFTFDGAVNTELNANRVIAKAVNSEITSTGDIRINANSEIENMSLAGGVSFSNAQSGVGVGIGSVVNINNSTINALADGLNVISSKSVDINANSSEDLKFLAANLGIQANSGATINVNGIANVFLSDVTAEAINNSVLNSIGNVGITSTYNNENQGITVVGGYANGSSIGANLIGNVYNNHVNAELGNQVGDNSSVRTNGSVNVSAVATELMNLIPVGITVSTSGGNSNSSSSNQMPSSGSAVAANINANVVKDTVQSLVYGDILNSSSLTVNASDITTIYTRGGTVAVSVNNNELANDMAIGGSINVDVLNKKVNAYVDGANVISSGNVTVQAQSQNLFGAEKENAADITDTSNYSGDNWDLEALSDFDKFNMFYDFGYGSKSAASGTVITKIAKDVVNAKILNSNVRSGALTVNAVDYTEADAIIGKVVVAKGSNVQGGASVGANVFVLYADTKTNAAILGNSNLTITNDLDVFSGASKKSTLINIAGSGSNSVAINGSAVANVIKDAVTAQVGDGVIANAKTVDVTANSLNDLKGAVLSVAASGKASVGAIVYVNKQNGSTSAIIGGDNLRSTVTAKNNINVSANSQDSFNAALLNVAIAGKAGIGGIGVLNFVDSDVTAQVNNTDLTSTSGKIDVTAERGFNKSQANKSNVFRNWFKGTSAYTSSGSVSNDDIGTLVPLVNVLNIGGAGSGAAVAASVISNKMSGDVTAEVKNSKVSSSQGLNVNATHNFVNYDAIASVAGAGTGAGVSAVGAVNLLENNVTAQIVNSEILKGGVDVDAISALNLNQLVLSGSGSGTGAGVNAVVDYNNIKDKVHSYITNSIINGTTTVDSQHAIEINNILLAVAISGTGAAINVIPVLNNYSGETYAIINSGSTIKGAATINANDNIDNFSAIAGLAGSGTGVSASGYAIRNDYTNKVKAGIEGSTVNTTGNVNINANSVLDSTNALISGGFAGEGASITANVIINDIESEILSYINNSNIEKSGTITLNSNKDKQDKINNIAGSVSVAGLGAAASVNSIFNLYDSKTKSYVDNTGINNSGALTVKAFGDRDIQTLDIGAVGTGLGAAVLVNAIVNEVDSEVISYVDADSKEMNINGALTVEAKSKTKALNNSGLLTLAAAGVAAGANIGLHEYNDLAKAELKSNSDGQINATSASVNAESLYGIENNTLSVSAGANAIAGDVSIIKLGKRTSSYLDSEQGANIDDAVGTVNNVYNGFSDDNKFNPAGSSDNETGAIARSSANLKTSGNVAISADSKLQNRNGGDLSLTNVTLQAGGNTANVGVKSVKLSNNTKAEIAGGYIESTNGNVTVSANSENKVNITNTSAQIGALTISGAAGIYNNSALTQALINNASVTAKNVNVTSKSNNKSVIDNQAYVVSAANAGFSITDNKDTNNTYALISGNSNIDTGDLKIHATGDTELNSKLRTVTVSGFNMQYLTNNTDASSITKAMIENATGEMNLGSLSIIADTNKMSTIAKSNLTSGALAGLTVGASGAFMNAEMSAGVNSPSGLVIKNKGETEILSGVKKSDKNKAADITAEAKIIQLGIGAISAGVADAKVTNNAKVNAKLIANEHNANSLVMKALMNETGDANIDSQAYGAISVSSSAINSNITATLGIDVSGTNTIKNNAEITANNTATSNAGLKAIQVGAITVGTSSLSSTLNSNTTLNIGGNLNAKQVDINSNTSRISNMDYSSTGAGAVSVTTMNANNTVKGASTLNLNNYVSDSEIARNIINVTHKSSNTHNTVSNSIAAGAIAVSNMNLTGTFNTSTVLNVKNNSDINSANNISLNVENNNFITDSSAGTGGGAIALIKTTTENNYTSKAELNILNSKVHANNNLILSALSSTNNGTGIIDYAYKSSGFIAESDVTLKNIVNQTSKINLQNAISSADNTLTANAKTNSAIRQQIQTKASGFVAIPRNSDNLTVTNNNLLSLDSNSQLYSSKNLIVNLDSNSDLTVKSESLSASIGFKKPKSDANLNFTVNNTITDNGKIDGGRLVDINIMDNSRNNLTQRAHSESEGAIATSSESGSINKTINSSIAVGSTGRITSGKDINITYSFGKGSTNSEVSYKNTSYALFGIPIKTSGNRSNVNSKNNATMTVDGEVATGYANTKSMTISADGAIKTDGFYDNEYNVTTGGGVDPEKMKEQTLAGIKFDIDEVDSTITSISQEQPQIEIDMTAAKAAADAHKPEVDFVKAYVEAEENAYEVYDISDIDNLILTKLRTKAGEGTDTAVVLDAYIAKCKEIDEGQQEYYEEHQTLQEKPSIDSFLTNYTFAEFAEAAGKTFDESTDEGKTAKTAAETDFNTTISNIKTSFTSEQNNVANTARDGYKTYTYEITTGEGDSATTTTYNFLLAESSNKYELLKAEQAELDAAYDEYKSKFDSNKTQLESLENELKELRQNYKEAQEKVYISSAENSIVFNPIQGVVSSIHVDGIEESKISGLSNFKVGRAGLVVDNYSDKSLIFNEINLGKSGSTGLYIGKTQKSLADAGNRTGVTINNYYDISNPFADTVNQHIDFNARVVANGDFYARTESGNINLKNMTITADKTDIIASQGDVNIYNNGTYTVRENDKITAGNDINISAGTIDIKGALTAGYGNRSITITDSMLSDLTKDYLTGNDNLINIEGTNQQTDSPYLKGTNNIKAIYKDNKIYLFDVQDANGNVNITANSANITGTIRQNTGYQTINITNNTNKELVVGDISNVITDSVMLETIGSNKSFTSTKTNTANASTTITSNGKVTIDRPIYNGIANEVPTAFASTLNIASDNGIDVNNIIVAAGNTTLTNKANGINIDNLISVTKGNINISNQTGGVDVESAIRTTLGTITISNIDGGIKVNDTVASENGAITITNTNGGIDIQKEIQTALDKITISNVNGNINIDDDITSGSGAISITNTTGDIISNAEITTENGSITLSNQTGNINIKDVINADIGSISISNNTGDTTITDNITSGNGKISIVTTGKGNITLADYVNPDDDNKTVQKKLETGSGAVLIQNSEGAIEIAQSVKTDNGTITISNGGGNTTVTDDIISGEGVISIVTSGKGNITLADYVNPDDDNKTVQKKLETGSGAILIQNSEGAINIAQSVKTNNGTIRIENGAGDTTVTDDIISGSGAITVKTTGKGNITLADYINPDDNNKTVQKKLETGSGAILIQNSEGAIEIAQSVKTDNGTITIENGIGGIEAADDITSGEGNITITSSKGGIRLLDYLDPDTGKTLQKKLETKDGKIVITNTDDGIIIAQSVNTENGEITITNTNGGIEAADNITSNKGNITITNDKGGIKLLDYVNPDTGKTLQKKLETKDGNIVITNTDDGIKIAQSVNTEKGEITITNTNGGIETTDDITTGNGNITITNDKGGIKLLDYVDPDTGKTLQKKLETKDGNIVITNTDDGIKIAQNINTENGEITITNTNGGIETTDDITTGNGNITITNVEGGIKLHDYLNPENELIAKKVETKKGDITIINTNGGTDITSDVMTDEGNIRVSNQTGGSRGINVNSIISTLKGFIKFFNKEDGTTLAGNIKSGGGNIDIDNINGGILSTAVIETANGDITITNKTGGTDTRNTIETDKGDITITNDEDGIKISGDVTNHKGNISITSNQYDVNGKGGIDIYNLTSTVMTDDGQIDIVNNSGNVNITGNVIDAKGNINITNKDGNLVIGEYNNRDNYIWTKDGNVVINQTNGNILNGIVDVVDKDRSNYNIGNFDNAYKTLIAVNGNLTINAEYGDIGAAANANPGLSINSSTRDYTESINVNVTGNIIAQALNNEMTDKRLINLRAKESDFNLKNITADGNVMLTAADWKQADNVNGSGNYNIGYKVLNTADALGTMIKGENVSIISSDIIGTSDKPLFIEQTANKGYSASLYSENDLNLEIKTDRNAGVHFHQILSKQGDLNIGMGEDSVISELVSSKGINVNQRAQNLTIYSIGKLISEDSTYATMEDILAPHDNIAYNLDENLYDEQLIPSYINIKVLDAMDTSSRSDSNLKIYTGYVKGNHSNNEWYSKTSRLADVTLMADNIWALSNKAPSSIVSAPTYPSGKYMEKTYTADVIGDWAEPNKKIAEGINAYGKGDAFTFDILGVDKNYVDANVWNPNRTNYIKHPYISKFERPDDIMNRYDSRIKNAVISINDYSNTNRGVEVDTLYSNYAYINTSDTHLSFHDAYINNYAELQNGGINKTVAAVDNDYRRFLETSDLQLFTAKTGKFNLYLDDTIYISTNAPAVYYNPHKLVNGYHSVIGFMEDTFKENVVLENNLPIYNAVNDYIMPQESSSMYLAVNDDSSFEVIAAAEKLTDEEAANDETSSQTKAAKPIFVVFDTMGDLDGISSNTKVYSISTTGALIENDNNYKEGSIINLNLNIDGLDIIVKAKVMGTEGGIANIKFINMPRYIANKLLYKYMQANSEKMNLTAL